MDIQAQHAPALPTYAWAWHSPAAAAPPLPRTITAQPPAHTSFVNQPAGCLPSADDSQFTTPSRPAGGAIDSGTLTVAERQGALRPTTKPAVEPTEVQRLADHRMQLLAVKYAMKDKPGAEGEREVLARLKILNAKLSAQAPLVTSEQVSMLEDMARRSDELAARRAARLKERARG